MSDTIGVMQKKLALARSMNYQHNVLFTLYQRRHYVFICPVATRVSKIFSLRDLEQRNGYGKKSHSFSH